MTRLRPLACLLLFAACGSEPEPEEPSEVVTAVPENCRPHVVLPSAPEEVALLSLPLEEGEGSEVGTARGGAFGLIVDERRDEYKIVGAEGRIGWLPKEAVERVVLRDVRTHESCSRGGGGEVRVERCSDGRLYVGNDPDGGCE